MRSGPISETFADFFATLLTKRYSSSGISCTSFNRALAGRRCDTAVPAWCICAMSQRCPGAEARVLLQPHRLAHRLILDGVQRRGRDLAVIERNARFLNDLWPQQAADH